MEMSLVLVNPYNISVFTCMHKFNLHLGIAKGNFLLSIVMKIVEV